MLDAAVDAAAAWPAERSRDRRDEAERDPAPAAVRGRGPEDGRADREPGAVAPFEGGGSGRVDLDDREVAVAIDARDRAASPIGRRRR